MSKRTLVIITIILVFLLLGGWYHFTRESKYFTTSAFSAVPVNSAVIARINNIGTFAEKTSESAVWSVYANLPGIASLTHNLHFIDSLIRKDEGIKEYLINKDITIIGGEGGNIYLLELSGMDEKTNIGAFIDEYFARRKASFVTRKKGEATARVYYWSEGPSRTTFCISFYKGICIAGTDVEGVLEAAGQLDQPSLTEDAEFQKVNKTASPDADVNIFINHHTLENITSGIFPESVIKGLINSPKGAKWSEIDFSQHGNEQLFNGFTFASDSLHDYSGIMLQQKPAAFDFEKYFPNETSFFLCLNTGNIEKWFEDYEKMLSAKGELENYKNSLTAADTLYSVNLQSIVKENIEGAAGIVFTRFDPANNQENRFFLMKTSNGSKADSLLLNLAMRADALNKRGIRAMERRDLLRLDIGEFRLNEQIVYKIYQMPVKNFGERVFGKTFAGVFTNYCTVYGNCVIMGASFESVKEFIRSLILKETLDNNPIYKEFAGGLSQPLSLYLWISPGRALPFLKDYLSVNIYGRLEEQTETLRKVESAGWQLGAEEGKIYNVGRLVYNPVIRTKPSTIWRCRLDSVVTFSPQLVINPEEKERPEVVVQDAGNNLYLIGNDGRILWKIKLKRPVMGEVYQVNYFRNKKLQFLFNTEDAIHMIDREGNYIKNYPVILPAKATNGIGVFDYDRSFDYRIFVACNNKRVYAFDRNGTLITGWEPSLAEGDILQPVQFFRVAGKDYIVYSDKGKTYIMDRKGKPRVMLTEQISPSQNNGFTLEPARGINPARLITTDIEGTICMIGFDGSVKKLTTDKFSDKHFFICEDLDNNGLREYIFIDGDSLKVYNSDGKLRFSKKFPTTIDIAPKVFDLPEKGKKIGIADSNNNQLYLYNANGSDYDGFPIEGNSGFNTGIFIPGSGRFNLIAGTADGYLNNYSIK